MMAATINKIPLYLQNIKQCEKKCHVTLTEADLSLNAAVKLENRFVNAELARQLLDQSRKGAKGVWVPLTS